VNDQDKSSKQSGASFGDIERAAKSDKGADVADEFTKEELRHLRRSHDEEIAASELERRIRETELDERKKFARSSFRLTISWLIIVLLVLMIAGFKPYQFYLPEKVLITLVGSTTINVIALAAIVLRYLFRNQDSSRKSN
jgi:uncharacterized membrane protein